MWFSVDVARPKVGVFCDFLRFLRIRYFTPNPLCQYVSECWDFQPSQRFFVSKITPVRVSAGVGGGRGKVRNSNFESYPAAKPSSFDFCVRFNLFLFPIDCWLEASSVTQLVAVWSLQKIKDTKRSKEQLIVVFLAFRSVGLQLSCLISFRSAFFLGRWSVR